MAEITFDPAVISYEDLLEVFFTVHDPTTLNRQGNDVGEQYRSVIFYRDEEQHKTAQKVIAELTKERAFADPIVTTVEPASTFYPAEEYHQDYWQQPSLPAVLHVRGLAQGEEDPGEVCGAVEDIEQIQS